MTNPISKSNNQIWKWKRHFLTRDTNPHMQWMALLRVFFVVCICLIIASFYFLYQLKSEQIFQIKKPETTLGSVNAAQLKSVTTVLNARAQAQTSIRVSAEVGDPSL